MIKYALKCEHGHVFDSWFASAAAFEKLSASGHVTCAVCGSAKVNKAVMAPRVSHNPTESAAEKPNSDAPSKPDLDVAKIRDYVEKNTTYVGDNFAKEARAQHLGDKPERAIWGQARPEEAKSLVEDGVPIAPLPFIPSRKTN